MEKNVFRDYYKAENSEDEEANRDLQSRLYAEIYYASNSIEDVDTKADIKLETPNIDSEEPHGNTNTNKASNSNDNPAKTNFGRSQTKTFMTNDLTNDLLLMENDDKSNITINEIDTLDTDDKNNLNIPSMEVLEHSKGIIVSSKNNKQLTTCQMESTKSNSDSHNVHNIDESTFIKSENEMENKEELKFEQTLSYETNATVISDNLIPRNQDTGNNVKGIQENVCVKPKVDNSCDNILKKYGFAKLFINKLYLQKYQNIKKRLQELEKEKEENLKNNEKNQQTEQLNAQIHSVDQTEKNSSCNEKIQQTNNYFEEVTLLSSETESDSEDSILEVPIPPKPQPPVINLQDSDDNLETSDSDSDIDKKCSFVIPNENNLPQNKETCASKTDLHSSSAIMNPINDTLTTNKYKTENVTEDIILNCTEVQKGASNIREIIEVSKNIQNELEKCSDKHFCEKDSSVRLSEMPDNNLGKTNTWLSSVSDKNHMYDIQLPLETISDSNDTCEVDKSKTFAEDITITNFCISDKSSSNRKRHCEDDSEPYINAKQRKTTDNENIHSETNFEQHENENKSEGESWDEYFFRPMPDRLKAFYNESRGQENFDVEEIQSKMSKDPRLWTILDEDLKPKHSRQRFWNVKCKSCQIQGHQAYNCPQLPKRPRCHMCGIPGHIETRCPQKMCLTCGKKQGTFRKTCEFCRTLYCQMCKAIGHKSNECPDHWRKFHQTTRNSKINIPDNLSEVMKPADLLFCCNCAKRGHDSSTCREYRWSQHFPTPAFVTNYTVGFQMNSLRTNNYTPGVIPLSRKASNRNSKVAHSGFPETKDDLKGCHILYSYGVFRTRKVMGEEIIKKIPSDVIPQTMNFLENPTSSFLLEQLVTIVSFELKIYYNPEKVLTIRIRAGAEIAEPIYEIFIYWLKLRDDEKHLSLDVSLPRSLKTMLGFLTVKWEELEKNELDPSSLHGQIEILKRTMTNIRDPIKLSTMSKKILELRRKLLIVFHAKPKLSKLAIRLQNYIRRLERMARKIRTDIPFIRYSLFMHIMVIYNKMFIPRALTDSELKRLLVYAKEKKKEKEKERLRKQKKKLSPYEAFILSLRNMNKQKADTQHKQTCTKQQKSNSVNSSKITLTEKRQLSTITNYPSTSTTPQTTNSGTKSNIEDGPTEKWNKEDKITEQNVHPTEAVSLQNNQDIPNDNSIENITKEVDEKIVSHNSIFVPPKKSTCSDASSKQHENDNSSSTPCIELKSKNNMEEQTEITGSTNETIKPSISQEDDNEANVTKKKKSKKAKKAKLSLENNSQLNENQVSNVYTAIETKAKKVINEAQQFNLPYMNKAIEDVRKRINDKNVKQEHIDVLQRLINLEKDHRRYVSSVCSYLK